MTPLRFTHAQVRFEPAEVARVLESIDRRLRPTRMGVPSRRSP
jgi:hypothetical protein